MISLQKRYKKYKKNQKIFIEKRRKLLKEPEDTLAKISDDLNLFSLKGDFEKALNKTMSRAWKLYQRIYTGSPTAKDIDTFIKIADEIMIYDDFISEDQLRVWKVSRDLIWAYKTAFKGTQDEYDQASIVGE